MTAVGGRKDQLATPAVRYASADYLAFTDDPDLRVDGWEMRSLPIWSTDDFYARRRHARAIKILMTMLVPGYDFYIWHDGTHEVVMDPADLIRLHLPTPQHHFASYRHRTRDCLFSEAKELLRVKLDDPDNVRRQVRDYLRADMPRHAGLWETGVILRRNSETTRRLELAWWDQLARYSSRDQLSLPFVEWKLGLPITEITGGNVIENDCVRRVRRHNFFDHSSGASPIVSKWIKRLAHRLRLVD